MQSNKRHIVIIRLVMVCSLEKFIHMFQYWKMDITGAPAEAHMHNCDIASLHLTAVLL